MIKCPICEKPLRKMVKLTIWCDADRIKFNKRALRGSDIDVSHIDDLAGKYIICTRHGYVLSYSDEKIAEMKAKHG